jgi:hypothetical protein
MNKLCLLVFLSVSVNCFGQAQTGDTLYYTFPHRVPAAIDSIIKSKQYEFNKTYIKLKFDCDTTIIYLLPKVGGVDKYLKNTLRFAETKSGLIPLLFDSDFEYGTFDSEDSIYINSERKITINTGRTRVAILHHFIVGVKFNKFKMFYTFETF